MAWLSQEHALNIRSMAASFRAGSPQEVFEAPLPHGSFIRHSARIAPHASTPALVEGPCPNSCVAHRPAHSQGHPWLCQSPGPLESTLLLPKRGVAGFSCQEEGNYDRCLQDGLGHPERQQDSLWLVDNLDVRLAHQPHGNDGGSSGHRVLVHSDNRTLVAFINHQGGLRSHPLYRLASHLLLRHRGTSAQ